MQNILWSENIVEHNKTRKTALTRVFSKRCDMISTTEKKSKSRLTAFKSMIGNKL